MGKLSTIEDVERRRMAESEPANEVSQKVEAPVVTESVQPQQSSAKKSAVQEDIDFHGLDTQEKRSAGHTALIVAAVVIVIAVAINFANYSLHFF